MADVPIVPIVMHGPADMLDQVRMVQSRPTNVITALHAVLAEVGGIEKKRGDNESGGGVNYKFRGIDAISAAAQPLFGKHGVVIVPKVINQTIEELTVNNKPWTDTFVTVEWTLYGPGGVEDRIVSETTGWGRDNADKGVNKAMTGAFKNLLLRILCIGDPQDDTDGHTHERDSVPLPVEFSDESLAVYERLRSVVPGSAMATVLKAAAAREGKRLTAAAFDVDPLWRNEVSVLLSADVQVIGADGKTVTHTPASTVTINEADMAPVDPEPANGRTDAAIDTGNGTGDTGTADTPAPVAAPGGSPTVVDVATDNEKTDFPEELSTVSSTDGEGTGTADAVKPHPPIVTDGGDPICQDCGEVGHETIDCSVVPVLADETAPHPADTEAKIDYSTTRAVKGKGKR